MAKAGQFDTGAFRDLYCDLMEEVKRRITVISDVTEGGAALPRLPAHELCYLQLRMICELIALGCLAAHGDILKAGGRHLPREYSADRIIKALSKLHPDFYPRPSRQIIDEKTGRPSRTEPIEDGYLDRKNLLSLYGECGNVLHRGNFEKLLHRQQGDIDLGRISDWKKMIVTLLNHHQIQVVDRNQMFWVLMQGEDGKVHGALMKRVADSSNYPEQPLL